MEFDENIPDLYCLYKDGAVYKSPLVNEKSMWIPQEVLKGSPSQWYQCDTSDGVYDIDEDGFIYIKNHSPIGRGMKRFHLDGYAGCHKDTAKPIYLYKKTIVQFDFKVPNDTNVSVFSLYYSDNYKYDRCELRRVDNYENKWTIAFCYRRRGREEYYTIESKEVILEPNSVHRFKRVVYAPCFTDISDIYKHYLDEKPIIRDVTDFYGRADFLGGYFNIGSNPSEFLVDLAPFLRYNNAYTSYSTVEYIGDDEDPDYNRGDDCCCGDNCQCNKPTPPEYPSDHTNPSFLNGNEIYLVCNKSNTSIIDELIGIVKKKHTDELERLYRHVGLLIPNTNLNKPKEITYMACREDAGVMEYTVHINDVDIYPIGLKTVDSIVVKDFFEITQHKEGSMITDMGYRHLAHPHTLGSVDWVAMALNLAFPKKYSISKLVEFSKLKE